MTTPFECKNCSYTWNRIRNSSPNCPSCGAGDSWIRTRQAPKPTGRIIGTTRRGIELRIARVAATQPVRSTVLDIRALGRAASVLNMVKAGEHTRAIVDTMRARTKALRGQWQTCHASVVQTYQVVYWRNGIPYEGQVTADAKESRTVARAVLRRARANAKPVLVNRRCNWTFPTRINALRTVQSLSVPAGSFRKDGIRVTHGQILEAYVLKQARILFAAKTPKTEARHVGVELEFYLKGSHNEGEDQQAKLAEAFNKARLGSFLHLGTDGSVNGPAGETGREIRILAPESEIHDIIARTCAVIKAHGGTVNKTCGLHVHIDMRNRNAEGAFARLVSAQPLLFALVPPARRDNSFAKRNTSTDIRGTSDRYRAINGASLRKHGTIEVRLHSGTVNAEKVCRWIDLLLAIVDGPAIDTCPKSMRKCAELWGMTKEWEEYAIERVRKFNKMSGKGRVSFLAGAHLKRKLRAIETEPGEDVIGPGATLEVESPRAEM